MNNSALHLLVLGLVVLLVTATGYFVISESSYREDFSFVGIKGAKYKGYFSHGFELNNFAVCQSSDLWSVRSDFQEVLPIEYREDGLQEEQLYYLELNGIVATGGGYGHMGGSDNELRVLKVDFVSRGMREGCANNTFLGKPFKVELIEGWRLKRSDFTDPEKPK